MTPRTSPGSSAQAPRLALAALLAAVGCAAPLPRSTAEALLAADRAWSEAALAGNLAQVAATWGEGALCLHPGVPVGQGQQAILQLVQDVRTLPGSRLAWDPLAASLSAAGDLGYTWGTLELTAVDDLGELRTRRGHYLSVWRVQADDAWRCVAGSTVFGPEGGRDPAEITEASRPEPSSKRVSGTTVASQP